MATTRYAIALGSNRRHGHHGSPANIVRAAARALTAQGMNVEALSTIRHSRAFGPAGRNFANAALILTTDLSPPTLLARLKRLERSFGRRFSRRWGPRVLDLDIVLWSEGSWREPGLRIPHPAFRKRAFVLDPLAEIAPGWRDPDTRMSVRQLRARHMARRPMHPNHIGMMLD